MSISIGLVRELDDAILLKRFTQGALIAINEVLQSYGLPPHTEPPVSFVEGVKLPQVNWSYSTIHYLRYVAAKFIEDSAWIPEPSLQQNYKIPTKLYDKICQEQRSHLICHSDFDGYYVPIDFEKVIFDKKVGGWLGSSVRLRCELEDLADKLKFKLGEPTWDLERLLETRKSETENTSFGYQKWLLLCMYNIANASTHYGSAIYFR